MENNHKSSLKNRKEFMILNWQPIKTATKDGTFYLATNGKKYAVLNSPRNLAPGQWEKIGTEWFGCSETSFSPTHWMSLPKFHWNSGPI